MNKKILAAVFSMALLCSCGNGNAEELSETGSESVFLASGAGSEATVTTAAAETTSEAVSEETEIAAEVSEAEEKVPITRNFFNDDVVWEEVLLPVKVTAYHNDGTEKYEKYSFTYEYDAAGNKSKSQMYTYEYDYNPDGTYNSVFEYSDGKLTEKIEYKFDSEGRLIRTSKFRDGKKYGFEYTYTYDEADRLYEEFSLCQDEYGTDFIEFSRRMHEYDGNIENVYFFYNEELTNSVTYEYEGDKLKKWTSTRDNDFWEYFYDENDRLVKEIYTYDGGGFFIEYFYNDDGSIISQKHDMDGVLTYNETEYAMIPKIKTNIKNLDYSDI